VFVLCDRSRSSEDFPRYPRLPVRGCRGFEPLAAGDALADGSENPPPGN
jgi:hypothetical protein